MLSDRRFTCVLHAGLSALLVLVLISRLARAGTNEQSLTAQFRVNHLAYDKDGRLEAASDSVRKSATSLFYGEPVTNVVFRAELPAVTESRSKPPLRPVRPRYRVDRWDGESGLPANKVEALAQTRDGYLWIGTVGGLARFDGVRFTVFNDANTPGMQENGNIGRALFEDDKGKLWVGTERGMLRYSGGQFGSFPGQDEVRGQDVRCLAPRSAGGFWFGAGGRLGYWDGSAIHWQLEIESDSAATKRILSVAETPGGILWMGTFGGLWKADLNNGNIARVPLVKQSTVVVNGLLFDRHRNLWIGSSFGVWRLAPDDSEPRPINGREPKLRDIPHGAEFFEDTDGTIWATTGFWKGAFRLRSETNGVTMTPVADEVSVTSCVLVDREGAVWMGSQDRGLFRLRRERFATLLFNGDHGLDEIRSVTEGRDGSLWFASRTSIGNWSGSEITLLDVRALGARRTSPIIVPRSGEMRTSFPTGGLFGPALSANSQPAVPLFPEIGEVQSMCVRRDGSFWMGTAKGLYHVKGPSALERIEGLSHGNVQALLEDRDGDLWIGTGGGGLNCLSKDGVRAYTSRAGLVSDNVGSLHQSEDGSLWVGTQAGLYRWKEGHFAGFAPDSGVPQRAIHCILEDDYGRLWISHAAGIIRVARADLEAWLLDRSRMPAVAEFGTTDGILNPESAGGSQPAGLKTSDGRLWFPTRRGLAVVDPSECPTNIAPPQVIVESIIADGEALPIAASFRLSPGRGRDLDIRFTATSLHSPDRVRVRYELEGQDSGWRDAGSVRQASYANLRPGQYRFRIQARNHEGRWSEREAVLAFSLAPHFWQTWPFYLISGLGVAAGAARLIASRLRQQRRRLEGEGVKALEHERLRIARDMHDHLGAQLAGIALAADESGAAHQKARETLRELNDLIWSVHPNNDTLSSLADFIGNFASRYLSTAGVELDLDLPARIPARAIPSSLRQEIAAMFKEALRNVIQHAQAKRVVVRMEIRENRLVLSVRDDGRGFESSVLRSSIGGSEVRPSSSGGNGLRNFHTRSANLGGVCRIKAAPGHGTEVEFSVPLNGSN